MASWAPPIQPLTEDEYALEDDDNPTRRQYDEMNRDIEPRMEEWRAEQ